MTNTQRDTLRRRVPLLDYLKRRGWKAVRDRGRDEVSGICPLHRDTLPSFYVNRRKQLFYCHGCGRGGDVIRLVELLDGLSFSDALARLLPSPPVAEALEETYRFYQTQLTQSDEASQYLYRRGIHSAAVVSRMRIGYAPGGCLRGHLARLGFPVQTLIDCGLADERGRDCLFRCLTFPLEEAGNLYARSIEAGGWRHRFLRRSKGGLYGWAAASIFSSIVLVEGLFDLAALWQAGFPNTVAVLGSHLQQTQLDQLCQSTGRILYLCFDADDNGSGQAAARSLSRQLRLAGIEALRVALPGGQDPASFFAAGASRADFMDLMERAQP